jgi:ubiquinone/menaquinone biosynthesis C-methylase UbiE
MKVDEAYEIWSRTYGEDRNLTRDLDEQITRQTLNDCSCKSILEIGCGTGKNTNLFARIGERVHALDFSAAMIEKARQKSSFDNVTFRVADITQRWPFDDRSVDLVTCNLVLEHIENLGFVFGEAARVLVDQGKLLVSELHPFRQYEGVQAHFNRDDETIEIPAFVHHISDFLDAASASNFSLLKLEEAWHVEDVNKPPRLISFMFQKELVFTDS